MSEGSVAAIIDFVIIGLVVVLCLVNSHLAIGQLDPWLFRTSIEPKSTRPSIFSGPFRVKNLSILTVSEA